MLDILFKKYLKSVIQLSIRYPAYVIIISVLLSIVGLALAFNLRIDNDFSKLIPSHYPSVQALEKLREQVGSTHEAAVVIESSSFELNKEYAERLIPEAMKLENSSDGTRYFNRYEFRKETGFLESNALYFATNEELDLLDTFLDEEIEYARLLSNPFYFELDDDRDEADSLGQVLDEAYDELIGSEYPISADSLVMAVRFYPAGSQTDIELIRNIYHDLGQLTERLSEEFGYPDMQIILAGRLLRNRIEVDSIYTDVRDSFWAGTIMLLLMVITYFFYKNYRARTGNIHSWKIFFSEISRLPVTAMIIAFPLVVSLCWTFGVTWLAFETLNIMTSTLGLLLFGMGIDFGIHFYARYIEERGERRSIADSIENTFLTTGQAITAVGITTSAAFFILMLADFKGFSEFGAIAGIGILFSIITMIIVLPALIVLLENLGLLKTEASILKVHVDGKNKKTVVRSDLKLLAVSIVIICMGATVLSGWYAKGLSFEYDFGKLEPVFESYNEVAREARKVYSDRKTRNAAYITADFPAEAVEIRSILTERMASDTLTSTIESLETLQDRYPFTVEEQQQKLLRIKNIRRKLEDPFIRGDDSEQLQRLKRAASTTEPLDFAQIPDFLLDPFTAKDGTIGNLVIIYPSVPLSDGRNSMNFADDLSNIVLSNGKVYNAASTSIVASDMLRLMIHEAPRMIAYTLTFIIFIKLLIFRSIKWMLLALLPLAASFLWLFGFMEITGWMMNFYNIVVLPTILGIGDDSGIHIIHRYLEEGKGSIYKVIRSTGEHITVSSMTTMLGFAGLLFSSHPGMRSIGELAVTGIGLMLIASLVLLPALLYLLEKHEQVTNMIKFRSNSLLTQWKTKRN